MNAHEETLDTKTGIIYASRMAAGNAVAHEYKLESTPGCGLVWYDVVRLAKLYRFADVRECRYVRRDGSLGRKYVPVEHSSISSTHSDRTSSKSLGKR